MRRVEATSSPAPALFSLLAELTPSGAAGESGRAVQGAGQARRLREGVRLGCHWAGGANSQTLGFEPEAGVSNSLMAFSSHLALLGQFSQNEDESHSAGRGKGKIWGRP